MHHGGSFPETPRARGGSGIQFRETEQHSTHTVKITKMGRKPRDRGLKTKRGASRPVHFAADRNHFAKNPKGPEERWRSQPMWRTQVAPLAASGARRRGTEEGSARARAQRSAGRAPGSRPRRWGKGWKRMVCARAREGRARGLGVSTRFLVRRARAVLAANFPPSPPTFGS